MRKAVAIITLITFLSFQARSVYAWVTIPTPSPQVMAATAAVTIGGIAIYLSTESGRATVSGYYKKVYYNTVQNGSQLWATGYALYSTASMIQKTMANSALTNLKGILNTVTSYLPTGGVTATLPTNNATQKFAGPNYYQSGNDALSAAQARITWVNSQSNHQSVNTPQLTSITPSAVGLTNGQWTVYYVGYNMIESGSIVSYYDYYAGAASASQVQQNIDATAFQNNISTQVATNPALQGEVDNVIAQAVAAPPSNLSGPPVYQTYPFSSTASSPVVYTDSPTVSPDTIAPAVFPPFTMPTSSTTGSTGTGGTTTTGTTGNPSVVTLSGTYTGGNASTLASNPYTIATGSVTYSRYGARLQKFISDIKATPLFGLIGNFFGSVPTGNYSSSVSFNGGVFGSHTYDFSTQYAGIINTLKGLILLIFSYISIRILVLKR